VEGERSETCDENWQRHPETVIFQSMNRGLELAESEREDPRGRLVRLGRYVACRLAEYLVQFFPRSPSLQSALECSNLYRH
jgi:hypothetical protein